MVLLYTEDKKMIPDKYQAKVDQVLAMLRSLHKGDTVSWERLELTMGMHREDKGGWTIIKRVRAKLLKDRKINTIASPRLGLRLLTDRQAARELPAMRQKRARRQISKALRETQEIDQRNLTRHESVALAFQRKHLKAERLAISRGEKESAALLRPAASVFGRTQ